MVRIYPVPPAITVIFGLYILGNIITAALGMFSVLPYLLTVILLGTSMTSLYAAAVIWAEDRPMQLYFAFVLLVSTVMTLTMAGLRPAMVGFQGGCLAIFTFLGIVLLPRSLPPERQKIWKVRLAELSLVALMLLIFLPGLYLTAILLHTSYDLHILALQDAVGLRWTIDLVKLVPENSIFYHLLEMVYFGILGSVMLMRVVETRQGSPGNILTLYMVAGLAGYASYYMVPGIGPLPIFPGYPYEMPAPGAFDVTTFQWHGLNEPRNAMISLHATWALLMIISALNLRRPAAIIFILLGVGNILATLVLRMHWVLDLVPAVPLAIATHLFCWDHAPTKKRRYQMTAALVGLIIIWLAVIRWRPTLFAEIPGLGWAAIAFTLVAPVLMWRKAKALVGP